MVATSQIVEDVKSKWAQMRADAEALREIRRALPLDEKRALSIGGHGWWSVRTYNRLKMANVHNVGELIDLTPSDVLAWRNAGKGVLREIEETLARELALSLSHGETTATKRIKTQMRRLSVAERIELTEWLLNQL